MLQKDNRTKILEIFFDNPLPQGGFQLREISRKVKLAPTSVKNYLNQLEKEKLILKKKHRIHGYPIYYAHRDNDYFIFLKKLNNIQRLEESGLLEYLDRKYGSRVIILFGSFSRGEDLIESDIDLFLLGKWTESDLSKYEKILGRKINILYSENISKVGQNLRNNLVNGIVMKGYLKVW